MNSFVQVLCWLLDQDERHFALIGRSRLFFQGLAARANSIPVHLCNNFIWRNLIQSRPDIHRQHDVAEFSAFFIQRHDLALFQGQWEARCHGEDGIATVDSGSTTQPVLLHLPTAPDPIVCLQVQDLLNAWAITAVACCALLAPPPVLLVQLARFHNHRGKVRKRNDAVAWGMKLQVPVFVGEGLHTACVQYQLRAMITHIGNSPKSGHYTATCVQDHLYWSCDDERRAVQLGSLDDMHAHNVYLLAYQRIDTDSQPVSA